MLTILDGSTFCVSDDLGDVTGGSEGLFAEDTRMLSRCRLLVDGARPLLLTARAVDYFSAAHYLCNAPTSGLPRDALFLARERFIGGASLSERLVVRNESTLPLRFELVLELASDFADILAIKARDLAFGDPLSAPSLPAEVPCLPSDPGTLRMADGAGYVTYVSFSHPPTAAVGEARFPLSLESHEQWELEFEVAVAGRVPSTHGPRTSSGFAAELRRAREARGAWRTSVPRLTTKSVDLARSYERSIADLASLRLQGIEGVDELPAAGMPWFMTLFGRDTAITSLETLLFGPELATGALRSLAALQATEDDPAIDAEPGKILHELRRGKTAEAWFPVYYGSLDSTPLFLVLLSEVWRWTGDDALVLELEQPARRAADWILEYGDRDGDLLLEYETRTAHGLVNQSWKDSGDSQRFRDGRLAVPPIAPAEVQGYAYDALSRVAELARLVWKDAVLAVRLDAAATRLAERFDAAFWLDDRETYALALDRDKAPVDALCSNIGHLLWSGIVPDGRRAALASALVGDDLWSGWGVRTMGTHEAAFNPLSYHNGTVWPHDTAIAAWGLARSGFAEEARLLARGLLDAAGFFEHCLPEVFAGFARDDTVFPVAYPTSARPQAWAAGAPVLCLTLLLGLEPDPGRRELASTADPPLPVWLDGTEIDGVRAFGGSWRVTVRNRAVEVTRSE